MFLGRDSGSIESCMLNPTAKILKILKNTEIRALFFIDATFLLTLKKDYKKGFLVVKNQILEILELGHDVGLHLHPHWVDSFMFSEGRWSFKKYDKFRIHSISEQLRSDLILDSYKQLSLICKEYSQSYHIDSFRAGGWCVQPFNLIKNDLKSLGIKYDFSVLPGEKKDNLPMRFYDFSNSPNDQDFWRFEDDVIIEDNTGYFLEVPTTMVSMNIFNVFKLKKKLKGLEISGNGKGVQEIQGYKLLRILKKIRVNMRYTLSCDYMNVVSFKKNINNTRSNLVVITSHPKVFTSESYKVLKYIVRNFKQCDYRRL
jgi:hypothetical protein